MRAVAVGVVMLGLAGASHAQEGPERPLYDQRLNVGEEITLPAATLGKLRVLRPGDLEQIMALEAPLTEAERSFLDTTIGTAFSEEPPAVRAEALEQLQRLSIKGFEDVPALEWALRDDFLGRQRPDEEIMRDVIRAAEEGRRLSLDLAGRALFAGEGVKPDLEKSHRFLEEAQRIAPSRAGSDLLARQYLYGWGTQPDLAAATDIWKPRADAGDVQASIDYADLLARRGRPEDLLARRGYLEAAAAHDADAAKYRLFQDAVAQKDPAELARWKGALEQLAPQQVAAAALLADYHSDRGDPKAAYGLLQSWANAGDGLAAAKIGRLLVRDEAALGGQPGDALEYLRIGLIEQQPEALLGLGEQALADDNLALAYQAGLVAEATGDPRVAQQAAQLTFNTCGALEKPCAPVPVLFITNRAFAVQANGTVTFGNAPDPQGRISYGVSTVRAYLSLPQRQARQTLIEGGLGWLGGLANCANPFVPSITCKAIAGSDMDRMAPVSELRRETGKDFFAWAQSLAPVQPGAGGQNVFLYVHGFATTFDSAVRQAASAAETSAFPGVPVLLSWVSHDGPFPDPRTRYMTDLVSARNFCPVLRQAVIDAGSVFSYERVRMLAHSMGTVAAFKALTGCGEGGSASAPWPEAAALGTLVLAAPDLAIPDLSSAEDMALFALLDAHTNNLSVYQSEHDWALNISSSWAFENRRRLGQGGEPRLLLGGAHMIDATGVENAEHSYAGISNHFYVFNTPQVARDLSQVLGGETDRSKRKCIRDEDYQGQVAAYSSVLPVCAP